MPCATWLVDATYSVVTNTVQLSALPSEVTDPATGMQFKRLWGALLEQQVVYKWWHSLDNSHERLIHMATTLTALGSYVYGPWVAEPESMLHKQAAAGITVAAFKAFLACSIFIMDTTVNNSNSSEIDAREANHVLMILLFIVTDLTSRRDKMETLMARMVLKSGPLISRLVAWLGDISGRFDIRGCFCSTVLDAVVAAWGLVSSEVQVAQPLVAEGGLVDAALVCLQRLFSYQVGRRPAVGSDTLRSAADK